MRKQFSNRDELITYILSNVKYFSPSYLSSEFALSQGMAIEICEEITKRFKFIKKCYMYDCPKCNASTGFGGYYPIDEISYMTCDSCMYEDDSDKFILISYYENNSEDIKKKDNLTKSQASYEKDLLLKNTPVEKIHILDSNENIIWHISDMHFGVKHLLFTPNHSEKRIENFLKILRRRNNIVDDLFIISGDLTTDGEIKNFEEFYLFHQKLIEVGVKEENILIVPGNHDAWLGRWRMVMIFCIMWNKFFTPKKVKKWPRLLESFNHNKIVNHTRKINGCEININLADTTILKEISIGHFPDLPACSNNSNDLKFLVLHHHFIDLEESWAGIRETLAETIMKVRNIEVLEKWVKNSNIDFIIHGHKHFQFFSHNRHENAIIVAAPSLSEAGNHKDKKIGFNCIIPRKDNFDILLAGEFDDQYVVKEYFSNKKYNK